MSMRRVLLGLWLLLVLSGCSGAIHGFQLGSDKGGSTYGFDTVPFEVQRADGRLLTGHASVRLQRIEFLTRNAAGSVTCDGGFTLDRESRSVPVSIYCSDAGILHGATTSAWSDHGTGTFVDKTGRSAVFRYGGAHARTQPGAG